MVLVGTPLLLARNGNCDSLTSRKEEDSPASACPSFAVDRTTETSSCLQAPCERHAARASHMPLQDALLHQSVLFLCQGTLASYICPPVSCWLNSFKTSRKVPHYYGHSHFSVRKDFPILQVTSLSQFLLFKNAVRTCASCTPPHNFGW